jgi:hypothetical protein
MSPSPQHHKIVVRIIAGWKPFDDVLTFIPVFQIQSEALVGWHHMEMIGENTPTICLSIVPSVKISIWVPQSWCRRFPFTLNVMD